MTMTESVIERAALARLESIRWSVRRVLLAQRLRDTLVRRPISGELRVQDAGKVLADAAV